MSRAQTIAFENKAAIITTFWVVHYIPNDHEWDIRDIEIFADAKHARLLADDVQVDDLDLSQLDALYRALDGELSRKQQMDRLLMRLAIERLSMVPA